MKKTMFLRAISISLAVTMLVNMFPMQTVASVSGGDADGLLGKEQTSAI